MSSSLQFRPPFANLATPAPLIGIEPLVRHTGGRYGRVLMPARPPHGQTITQPDRHIVIQPTHCQTVTYLTTQASRHMATQPHNQPATHHAVAHRAHHPPSTFLDTANGPNHPPLLPGAPHGQRLPAGGVPACRLAPPGLLRGRRAAAAEPAGGQAGPRPASSVFVALFDFLKVFNYFCWVSPVSAVCFLWLFVASSCRGFCWRWR